MVLSDTPHDEALVESRIGRRLFHATHRKRSEGDNLSYLALLALYSLLWSPAMHRAQAAQQRGNKVA